MVIAILGIRPGVKFNFMGGENRQVSPAWDKESSQGVLNDCFLFLRTFIEN